jgi:hypothetical protein
MELADPAESIFIRYYKGNTNAHRTIHLYRRISLSIMSSSFDTTSKENVMEHTIRIVQRDTGAWRLQVWVSFGLALLVCGTGLAWLPGGDLDRAFMVMGYFFCLSSAFVLSKYVRDNALAASDTPMWAMVVWGGFALSMALTAWGLWRMEINPTWKAYLVVSWLYLISSAFTLAKTLRDAYEAERLDRSSDVVPSLPASETAAAIATTNH